jgi:hypothetical protein
VLSGEATRADAEAATPPPHYILEHVGALADLLTEAHRPHAARASRGCAPATT